MYMNMPSKLEVRVLSLLFFENLDANVEALLNLKAVSDEQV